MNNDFLPLTKKYEIKSSSIHGKGVFATGKLQPGEIIGLAVITFGTVKSTDITKNLGIWINHSEINPNTILRSCKSGWNLVASKYIEPNTELTANYRDAPVFIKRPEDYGGNFKP